MPSGAVAFACAGGAAAAHAERRHEQRHLVQRAVVMVASAYALRSLSIIEGRYTVRRREAARVQSDERTDELMGRARAALAHHFGYDDFRPGQRMLVQAVLSGRDALGVMPTGAGKSMCYQIPGVVLPGLTLVVSPLVSLMGDQVRSLLEAGVRGAYLNSTLKPGAQAVVMNRALAGSYDVMYVAPERLEDPRFREFAMRASISLVAVDEAHCVSQWGQDFRPSYLSVSAFIASLPVRPPLIALTATATERVRAEIVSLLGLVDPVTVTTGFDRPNLSFSVERLEPKRKLSRIVAHALSHSEEAGIVYCSTRKDVEKVHEALLDAGVRATRYHAGLADAERAANQEAFINDDATVMVATNAFGMGIDKSNVRYVVHHNMPGSMEAYYQEAGRAGRDGVPSRCMLFWSDGDIATCRYFIERESSNDQLDEQEARIVRAARRRMLESMISYCYTTDCLRSFILAYFGDAEAAGGMAYCGRCSNCRGEFDVVDVTMCARSVMRCVHGLRGRFGKTVVCDVLRGVKSDTVERYDLDLTPTFGVLDESASLIKEVIELLAAGAYLEITEGTYPMVGLGPRGREAANDDFSLSMKRPRRVPRPKGRAKTASFGAASFGDDALFDRLRALRKRLADELGRPPYVVFSDATLRDMCAKRPASEEEMLAVSGVGATKFERYGAAFLDEIAAFGS